MDSRPHPYRVRSAVHGLSHGLKIARQLSIFAPVCALVPPFQVLVPLPEKAECFRTRLFLDRARTFEPQGQFADRV